MLAPLEYLVTAAAVFLALTGTVLAIARRARAGWYRPALLGLELLLLLQAAIAGIALLRGHRPDEFVTFLAYGVTSLVVVPALLALLASPDEEYGGPVWPNVLVAIAGIAVAVVVLRMGATWAAAGG